MAIKKQATKKKAAKKTAQKSTMIKIAEKVGEIAGKIMNEKDHLVEMAGEAIETVKTSVKGLRKKTEKTVKQAMKKGKQIKKSAAKKNAGKKTAVKRSVTKKKTVKKAAKQK